MRKAKKILAWLIVLGLISLFTLEVYVLDPVFFYALPGVLVGVVIATWAINTIIE